MSSYSGSVRSFQDDDESTLLNEKLDNFDIDSASETSEAWSYRTRTPWSKTIFNLKPSSSPLLQCIRSIGWLVSTMLPGFVQEYIRRDERESKFERLHATAYLDGMRGLAAFAVFLCHLSYSTFDVGHVWAAGESPEEAEENKLLLQLPVVRLFYNGPAMVAIFFVISGYALSYKPLKQMRSRDYEGLMMTLTSSVFRRALRLFLPCLASTFIIVCLVRLGIYQLTEDFANDLRAIQELHYWTAPDLCTQIVDWQHKMLNFVNVFDWSLYAGAVDIDSHLWTIPVEFRCSMALFITHVLVARMPSRTRLLTLVFLMIWGTYWNRWEMVPFWAGIIIAELDLIKFSREEEQKAVSAQDHCQFTRCRFFWRSCFNVTIFVTGLFLASYPDIDGHASPGYIWLTKMIPKSYTEKHRFWANVGAILIVWSVSNLSFIKRIFTTSILQYLGKISFPLYVCHGFVIHTFTYFSLGCIWEATDAYEDWNKFVKGFLIVASCTIVVTIWVSDVFLRVIDVRCVNFAKWCEKQIFVR